MQNVLKFSHRFFDGQTVAVEIDMSGEGVKVYATARPSSPRHDQEYAQFEAACVQTAMQAMPLEKMIALVRDGLNLLQCQHEQEESSQEGGPGEAPGTDHIQ